MSETRYYLKVPLRYLHDDADTDGKNRFAERCRGLVTDAKTGIIPSWAVGYQDEPTIEREED